MTDRPGHLYVAGPMRGYPQFNFPAFDDAAARLRAAGYDVFNPADRDRQIHGADLVDKAHTGDEAQIVTTHGFDLRAALAADTAWICRHADGLAVLPGWESSKGANAEVALARALAIPVNFVSHWLRAAQEGAPA